MLGEGGAAMASSHARQQPLLMQRHRVRRKNAGAGAISKVAGSADRPPHHHALGGRRAQHKVLLLVAEGLRVRRLGVEEAERGGKVERVLLRALEDRMCPHVLPQHLDLPRRAGVRHILREGRERPPGDGEAGAELGHRQRLAIDDGISRAEPVRHPPQHPGPGVADASQPTPQHLEVGPGALAHEKGPLAALGGMPIEEVLRVAGPSKAAAATAVAVAQTHAPCRSRHQEPTAEETGDRLAELCTKAACNQKHRRFPYQ
mmetsp:Transcript_150375/g.481250  ORF Transcript_150375/g.481250 Transcript_150375/m.481250 type:complete len:260 (-) Transcript_150375:43-822(-)